MFLSTFFMLMIILILLVAAFLFIFPVKAAVSFNSEQQPDIHFMMSWLSSLIKVYVIRHNVETTLTVNIFNIRILSKNLPAKKDGNRDPNKKSYRDYMEMLKSLKINKTRISASYGFVDPSITGFIFGAIELVSQYTNPYELFNDADFFTEIDYFNANATVEINAGISLIRMLRRNATFRSTHALSGSR